jgi:hypothetical protein
MAGQGKLIYQALALPDEALANGGTEILRAGVIDGELYVTARRAFKDPAKWGDVLSDVAKRVALLYSAEDTDLTEAEILTEIAEAFAADLGAKKVAANPKSAKLTASRKPAKSVVRRSSKRTTAKRRKR